MKSVKVFLASSEELRSERNEFSDLILQLNDLFEHREIEIKLIRWEHLDASMSAVHKQQEYNDKLRRSDICLVLYWTKFGEYTKAELDVAYQELKAGRNPRKLYVYFKETDSLTPELKEFKESFAVDYGHFFCRFENVDTMRLNFLLQFEASQNNSVQDRILKVENQKVKVDGQELVNLDNVPFAALNKEYQRLRADISELNEEIIELRVEQQSGNVQAAERLQNKLSKRNSLNEEFEQHQNFLFDFSLELTKLSGAISTERVARAMELFGQGKASEANAVLDLEQMRQDATRNLRDWKQGERLQQQRRDTLIADINGFLAKTKSAMADENLTMVQRFAQTSCAYESAIELAEKIDYDQGLTADIIFDYAYLCHEFKKFDIAVDLYKKQLKLSRNLALSNPEAYLCDVATSLNNLGNQHSTLNNYLDAEREYSEALGLWRNLAVSNPEAYLCDVAMALNNLGILHDNLGRYSVAQGEYLEALGIYRNLTTSNPDGYLNAVAMTLNNLGIVHCRMDNDSGAEGEFLEALGIYRNLAISNPDAYMSDVAMTLNNLGLLHKRLKNYDFAQREYIEALDIRRNLAASHPDAHLNDMADSLNSLGNLHCNINNFSGAEDELSEALGIYRTLAVTYPDAYLSDVAMTLNNLAFLHSAMNNYSAAESEYLEALDIYRTLADSNSDVYLSEVVHILCDMGELYATKIKNHSKAEKYCREAEELRKTISNE